MQGDNQMFIHSAIVSVCRTMRPLALFLAGLLLAAPLCRAMDHIAIDIHRDPRFLPYAIDTVASLGLNAMQQPLRSASCVIEPGLDSTDPGLMAVTFNNAFQAGQATQIGFRTCA